MVVLFGPGGAGKGTVAARLIERDPHLWLSRSWTTRPRRPGEAEDAYVFVDRDEFMERVSNDGFLEWAEFLGHCYGTPLLYPPPGHDLLLEIDLQGARQVVGAVADALLILLVPPSTDVQRRRLLARGDAEDEVERRIGKGLEEQAEGRRLTPHVVVNDDLESALSQVAGILDARRAGAP
ncbi:MAG: guanylate kinase [Acidimicrobiales bacterium]